MSYVYQDDNLAAAVSINLDNMPIGRTSLVQYWVGVKIPEIGAGYSFDCTVEDRSGAQSTSSGGTGDGSAAPPGAASLQGVFSFYRGGEFSTAHFDIGYFSPLGSFRYDYKIVVIDAGQ